MVTEGSLIEKLKIYGPWKTSKEKESGKKTRVKGQEE